MDHAIDIMDTVISFETVRIFPNCGELKGFFSCFGTQFCPKWSGHRKCSRFYALRMWFIVGLMLFCTILAPLRLGHVMFLVTAPIRGRARVSFFLCLHFRSVPLTVSTFPLHIPLCLFFCTCLMQGMWVGWGGVGWGGCSRSLSRH